MQCRICLRQNATKYNHLGATSVCHSCRGFFMRSVQTEYFKDFKHKASGCEVNSKTRKSCKKCRFELCLEVGMKITYVKSLEERWKKMLECQSIEKPKLTDHFQERQVLEDYCDKKDKNLHQAMFDIYSQNPELFTLHFCKNRNVQWKKMPTDQFLEAWRENSYNFFSKSMGFYGKMDDVSMDDLLVLLDHNFHRIDTFWSMLSLIKNHNPAMNNFLEFLESQNSGSLVSDEQLEDIKKNYSPSFTYDQIFDEFWAAQAGIEEEHEKICQDMMHWLDKIDSQVIDPTLLLMIQLILFYNIDGIESKLKEATKVQKLQTCYARLLHKYLVSKHEYQSANALFSRGLMLVHDTQRAFELSLQTLKL